MFVSPLAKHRIARLGESTRRARNPPEYADKMNAVAGPDRPEPCVRCLAGKTVGEGLPKCPGELRDRHLGTIRRDGKRIPRIGSGNSGGISSEALQQGTSISFDIPMSGRVEIDLAQEDSGFRAKFVRMLFQEALQFRIGRNVAFRRIIGDESQLLFQPTPDDLVVAIEAQGERFTIINLITYRLLDESLNLDGRRQAQVGRGEQRDRP